MLVTPQQRIATGIFSGLLRLGQGFRQRHHVTQAEIEPLPGDRVQRLRGIAHQCQAMADMLIGGQQAERIAVTFPGAKDAPQTPAKCLLQLTDKTFVVPAVNLLAIFTRMAPHQ
ncbi:hypothetical protein D3C80_1330800 [compost metagenome]